MMPPPVVSSWPPVRSLAFRVPFTTWYSWRGSGVGLRQTVLGSVGRHAVCLAVSQRSREAVRMAARLGPRHSKAAEPTPCAAHGQVNGCMLCTQLKGRGAGNLQLSSCFLCTAAGCAAHQDLLRQSGIQAAAAQLNQELLHSVVAGGK